MCDKYILSVLTYLSGIQKTVYNGEIVDKVVKVFYCN